MTTAHQRFDLEAEMALEARALERVAAGFLFGDSSEGEIKVYDGVAVVAVDGPLMQRGGYWFDGYAAISTRMRSALMAPEVRSVVLKINSPGGVCAGCFSAMRELRELKAAAGKPVLAYADESAFSAAYALACVADKIYLPREGGVGSVGVIGTLQDWSAFNAKMGVRVAVIVSGSQKADGHPDVPLSKDVIDRYQARIDSLADSFAELVGASRGMTTAAVRGLEAGCFYGDEAVKAGLADGVASFSEVVSFARSTTPNITRKAPPMNTKISTATETATLTAEDEATIKSLGLDREKFVAMRKSELAARPAASAGTSTHVRVPVEAVKLTAEDEAMIAKLSLDRDKFIASRREEIQRQADAAR
jgi:capsid assembly protease